MKINKYPDGSSYYELISNNPKGEYVFRVNSYEDLWHLNQLVDAHWNFFKVKPDITIPNLIDAQADRRFAENQSSGLKLVCEFLNSMNANFKIFHPHNAEVVEALMDNVEIISNQNFINKVLKYKLSSGVPGYIEVEKNTILMSSDAGGFKPLMKLCNQLNWQGETYSASKARDPETGKLTQLIDRKDFGGKDILIIDDICVYGGTFKGLSKLLREKNCGKLYLAVSHITVKYLGDNPVTDYFDKVFTTNSKFDEYPIEDMGGRMKTPNNLEIIKLF